MGVATALYPTKPQLTCGVLELAVPVDGLRSCSGQPGHLRIPPSVWYQDDLHQVVQAPLDHPHLQLFARRQVPQESCQQLSDFRHARLLQRRHYLVQTLVAADQVLVLVHGAAERQVLERAQSSDLDLGLGVANQAHQNGNGTMLSLGMENVEWNGNKNQKIIIKAITK